jgi:hypothetical protein
MALRVVGAGLGRTGTLSLKVALERLLGGPCYHMAEVLAHPEHIPAWHSAVRGDMPDWNKLLARYQAAVDEPAAAFWPELSEAFPEALVLLSVRDPQSWWQSADQTIFQHVRNEAPTEPPFTIEWHAMVRDLSAALFPNGFDDPAAAMAAFERHNARVREAVPAQRLIEWQTGDGWGPLCTALGVPVPDESFPHTNTRAQWRA